MVWRLHEGASRRQTGFGISRRSGHWTRPPALEHPALFRLMSTRDVSESLDEQGNLPEIFNEGYQLMLSGLAAAPSNILGLMNRC